MKIITILSPDLSHNCLRRYKKIVSYYRTCGGCLVIDKQVTQVNRKPRNDSLLSRSR